MTTLLLLSQLEHTAAQSADHLQPSVKGPYGEYRYIERSDHSAEYYFETSADRAYFKLEVRSLTTQAA